MFRKGLTILVVDDEDSQRRLIRGILENAGYTVVDGKDYDQALSVLRNQRGKVELVITDMALPGRDGCQLVKTLIEEDPGLCALFISGLTGAELCRFYGLATTDLHFLAKPFAAADLLQRVREVLDAGGPYLTKVAG